MTFNLNHMPNTTRIDLRRTLEIFVEPFCRAVLYVFGGGQFNGARARGEPAGFEICVGTT